MKRSRCVTVRRSTVYVGVFELFVVVGYAVWLVFFMMLKGIFLTENTHTINADICICIYERGYSDSQGYIHWARLKCGVRETLQISLMCCYGGYSYIYIVEFPYVVVVDGGVSTNNL